MGITIESSRVAPAFLGTSMESFMADAFLDRLYAQFQQYQVASKGEFSIQQY